MYYKKIKMNVSENQIIENSSNEILKYIFNESDSNLMILIKASSVLLLINLIDYMYKGFILYILYNNIMRNIFKNLPKISYFQMVTTVLFVKVVLQQFIEK